MRAKGYYKDNEYEKECRKCRVIKLRDSFWFAKQSKDKKHSYCKTCLYFDNGAYFLLHPNTQRKSSAKWREQNKERIKINSRRWRIANREYINESKKEWAKNNRMKQQLMQQKADKKRNQKPERILYRYNKDSLRRSKKRDTDITVSWLLQLKKDTISCIICGILLNNNGHLWPNGKHLDHIIPISKQGKHIMSNVRYICAQCNIKKHNYI